MRQPRIPGLDDNRLKGVPNPWRYPASGAIRLEASRTRVGTGLTPYGTRHSLNSHGHDCAPVRGRPTSRTLRPQAASRYHGARRRHRLGAGGEEVLRHRAERHGGVLGARRPCHDGHSRLLPGPGARQGNNDLTVMLKEADGCCFNDMILASEHNAEFQTLP